MNPRSCCSPVPLKPLQTNSWKTRSPGFQTMGRHCRGIPAVCRGRRNGPRIHRLMPRCVQDGTTPARQKVTRADINPAPTERLARQTYKGRALCPPAQCTHRERNFPGCCASPAKHESRLTRESIFQVKLSHLSLTDDYGILKVNGHAGDLQTYPLLPCNLWRSLE